MTALIIAAVVVAYFAGMVLTAYLAARRGARLHIGVSGDTPLLAFWPLTLVFIAIDSASDAGDAARVRKDARR